MSALNQLKRNISDLINDPQGYLRMVAENIGNSAAGRKAVINDRGAGMQNLSKEERRQQMQQAVLDNFGSGGMGALGIIKGKDGNWLTGSVENALSRLKSSRPCSMPKSRISPPSPSRSALAASSIAMSSRRGCGK